MAPQGGAPEPARFAALDIDLVADRPGIYAWYAQLGLSGNDWRPSIQDGVDASAANLTKAIMEYARIHESGLIGLTGSGGYGLGWRGTLRQDSAADRVEPTGESAIDRRLSGISQDPSARKLLTEMLGMSTPVFASPLYIGVATNLRQRLSTHREDFMAARRRMRSNPQAHNDLKELGSTFGERLAGTDISFEHLQVWVIPADGLSIRENDANRVGSEPAARHVAEGAEWVLQRIFKPLLGRN